MNISACFPAFNEATNLETLVRNADAALRTLGDRYEIIVVDDGSVDQTPQVLAAAQATCPALRTLQHERNLGYGAAVLTGLRAAQYDLVFLCDADNQFDLGELSRVLPLMAHADAVIGYRARRQDPPHRRIYGTLWTVLTRIVLGVHVRDVNCAFKIMRRDTLVRAGLNEMRSTGAAVSAELLMRLGRAGASIVETEVRHLPRTHGRPTGASPQVILRAFRELAALRFGKR